MSSKGIRAYARKALHAVALLGASACLGQNAFADEAPPPDESVVVTGRTQPQSNRLTAPLAETPRSITVIPQQVLEQTGVVNLQEALRVIPGITLGSGEGGTTAGDRPFIRGIDSSTDIYIDGIRDSGGTTREVFNIEQIDVSRGPGGAFVGRGSTGGAINIVSKAPRGENFADATVTVGTDETARVTGDLNYALGDNAAFRLNLMHHDAGVAGRDDVELHRWGVAPSLGLGLGTPNRATLSYYHLETDDVPDYGIPYLREPAVIDPIYGSIVHARPITGHNDDFYGLLNRDFRRTEADISTMRLEHDFGSNLTLSNTTRYGSTGFHQVVTNPDDSRGNVVNGFVLRNSKNRGIDVDTLANVTDLHGTWHTFGWEHSFDIGAEFSREDTHNQGYYVNGPGLPATFGFTFQPTNQQIVNTYPAGPNCTNPGALGATDAHWNCTTLDNPNPHDPWVGTVTRAAAYTNTTTDVAALYAFDTIEFNEQWSFNWGVRYDSYDTDQTGVVAPAPTSAAPNPVLAAAPHLQREDEFVNYTLGLVYQPVEALSFYAAYGTSTNPSGEGVDANNALSAAVQILPPEENRSYELGAKWQLFGERLLATAAIFRTEKTNARVVDDSGVTNTVGDQRIDGFELTVSGNITTRWSVFGGYTHLESELVDNGFFDRGIGAAPRFVPSPANGNRFPNTPEGALSIWTDYDLTDKLSIGGGASHMSDRFADVNNRISIPSYWRYDAMAHYVLSNHVELQLNLQNLSDERYATNPFQTHMTQIAPGRSALLSVNVRY